jgi:hypothetical protein
VRKITIVLLAAAIVFSSCSSAAFSDEEAEECFRAIARDSGGSAGDSSGYDRFFLNAFSHLGLAEGWTEEGAYVSICAAR